MKDLLPEDRPREKLRQHGAPALGDNELIALVIGNGSRHGNALTIANTLLAAHGGLHGLVLVAQDRDHALGAGGARGPDHPVQHRPACDAVQHLRRVALHPGA